MSDKAILVLVIGVCLIGLTIGVVVATKGDAATVETVVVGTVGMPVVGPPSASTKPSNLSASPVITPNPAASAGTENVRDLHRELQSAGVATFTYAMYEEGRNPQYGLLSSDDAVRSFESAIQKPQADAVGERLQRHAGNVSRLLKELGYQQSAGPRFMGAAESPVTFARHDGRPAVLLRGVFVDTVFNALRSTEQSRAATIAAEQAIPACRAFLVAFDGTDVDRFAVAMTYGSRDFSDPYAPSKGEMLAVVFDRATAGQFRDGHITAQQLLDRSGTYVDAGAGGVRKVMLTLE